MTRTAKKETFLAFDFPEGTFRTIVEVQDFEKRLISQLGEIAEIDGHDFGAGGATFFFFTDEAERAFERCKPLLIETNPNVRVTTRNDPEEEPSAIFP